ncbi:hypothetical protein [Gordonia aichiensis]
MSSDDRGTPSGGREAPGDRDDAFTGDPVGDPIREFVLGIATQIDHLAAIIGGTGQSSASTGSGARHQGFGDVAGEISSLVAEIGDLISRLVAALIAVLEAVANALRTAPAAQARPTAQYQPITVRIGTSTPRGGSQPHTGQAARRSRAEGTSAGGTGADEAGPDPNSPDPNSPAPNSADSDGAGPQSPAGQSPSSLPSDPVRGAVRRGHLESENEK